MSIYVTVKVQKKEQGGALQDLKTLYTLLIDGTTREEYDKRISDLTAHLRKFLEQSGNVDFDTQSIEHSSEPFGF